MTIAHERLRDLIIQSYTEDFDPRNDSPDATLARDLLIEEGEQIAEEISKSPAPWDRDELTRFAMRLSLCPIHFVDWAICFDDEDPGCDQIRQILPYSHDT